MEVEVEGKTLEEAIAAACQRLGQPREMLDIEVIHPGAAGIFGIVGVKKARIRARVKGAARKAEERPAEKPPREERPEEEGAEERPAGERRPSRRRRHRGGRRTQAAPEARPAEEAEPPEPEPEEPEEEEAEPAEPAEAGLEAVSAAAVQPALVLASEEMAAAAEAACRQIVAGLGYDELEVRASRLPGEVSLELVGEEAQALIGHRGDVLNALQHLVSKIANRQTASRTAVTVDAEGWRARRSQALEELAQKLARKAKETGKPQAMSPMNAHDRRVVHLALQQDSELTTKSRGEGALRKVVIFPRKGRRGKGNRSGRPRGGGGGGPRTPERGPLNEEP